MYKDVTVAKVPKITSTLAVTSKNRKKRQKFFGFAPLGARQAANGLMYKF